jgi:hypothetical protein
VNDKDEIPTKFVSFEDFCKMLAETMEPILPNEIPEGEVLSIGCDISKFRDFTVQTEIKIGGKADEL